MIQLPNREDWLRELSFLEQKKEDLPLPVYTPHLIEVMKTVKEDHLPWSLFVEGMVILLAADPDFIHGKTYRERLESDPQLLSVLREKMNELAETHHPLALPYALTLFRMEEEPQAASALAFYLAASSPALALQLADQAAESRDPVVLHRVLSVYNRIGQTARQEEVLQRLIEEHAPGEEMYRAQLSSLQRQKAEEETEAALRKEDFHQAINAVDQVGEMDRTGRLYALRGTANQGLGLFQASIHDFLQALDRGYSTPEIYNDLSIAYYLTGNTEEAIRTLQEGLEKVGEEERMLYNLLVYAIQADRTELAVDTLNKLKDRDIADPRIREDVEKILKQ